MPEIALPTKAKQDEILNAVSGLGEEYFPFFIKGAQNVSASDQLIYSADGKGVLYDAYVMFTSAQAILTVELDGQKVYEGTTSNTSTVFGIFHLSGLYPEIANKRYRVEHPIASNTDFAIVTGDEKTFPYTERGAKSCLIHLPLQFSSSLRIYVRASSGIGSTFYYLVKGGIK